MRRTLVWVVTFLCGLAATLGLHGQEIRGATVADLAAITGRGRALAEYDWAAWHATDAVATANPRTVEGLRSLAKKENGRWTVVFGALNADKTKFQVGYEARQLLEEKGFSVTREEPAKADEGFYLFAARALELALEDFGRAGRPYNAAVLPASGQKESDLPGEFYVYLYPAPGQVRIYPLGGDVRYLVSADGMKILAKRQMHKLVIENVPAKGKKVAAGSHQHVLSDEPEDTDVLHVLEQDPPVPEVVETSHFVYEVADDGTIRIRKRKK